MREQETDINNVGREISIVRNCLSATTVTRTTGEDGEREKKRAERQIGVASDGYGKQRYGEGW